MSLQVKLRDRKGVSIMVGYVLLVVFAVILSAITYTWIRTYVPEGPIQCQDGVSVFIKDINYNCSTNQLNLTIKNNGRFNILGYFVHATNESQQEVPTIDLSQYLNVSYSGQKFGASVAFISTEDNSIKPSDEKHAVFDLPTEIGNITLIQIIPTRLQEKDNKKRFLSCGTSKVEQKVVCGFSSGVPAGCVPDCTGKVCGSDGCGGSCPPGCDPSIEFCDAAGQCISNSCIPDLTVCAGLQCGNVVNGTCGTGSCGTCSGGSSCVTGQCVSNINNGICDPEETCADSDCEGQQNGCQANEICQLGSCVLDIPNSITTCADFCVFLGSYTTGFCRQSVAQCTANGETYESLGDPYCVGGGPTSDTCCCAP